VKLVFAWDVSPSNIKVNMERYGGEVKQKVKAVGDRLATKMESEARTNASWEDRTGNARSGLRAFAVEDSTSVTVFLTHKMSYGKHLELARGGKYAIIGPTLRANIPVAQQMLKDVLK
jgi:hypothetical protein